MGDIGQGHHLKYQYKTLEFLKNAVLQQQLPPSPLMRTVARLQFRGPACLLAILQATIINLYKSTRQTRRTCQSLEDDPSVRRKRSIHVDVSINIGIAVIISYFDYESKG